MVGPRLCGALRASRSTLPQPVCPLGQPEEQLADITTRGLIRELPLLVELLVRSGNEDLWAGERQRLREDKRLAELKLGAGGAGRATLSVTCVP